MKTLNFSLIVAFVLCSVDKAVPQELLPLKQLDLGQTAQQFTNLFANAKTVFDKREAGTLMECFAFVTVPSNQFWNVGGIKIAEGRVASIAYIQTEDFDRGFSNAPIILRHLVRLEGTNFTRAVARHHSKSGKVESPVLIWEKTDRVLAYSFLSLDAYQQGEPFVCQLSVFPRGKKLEEFFELATLPAVDKERVFRSVDEVLQKESPP